MSYNNPITYPPISDAGSTPENYQCGVFGGKNAFCERFSHNPVFWGVRNLCFPNFHAQPPFWTFLWTFLAEGYNYHKMACKSHKK